VRAGHLCTAIVPQLLAARTLQLGHNAPGWAQRLQVGRQNNAGDQHRASVLVTCIEQCDAVFCQSAQHIGRAGGLNSESLSLLLGSSPLLAACRPQHMGKQLTHFNACCCYCCCAFGAGDVYAYGIIMWEAFTGEVAFHGRSGKDAECCTGG
jgi:hypothetical protein